MDKLAVIVPTLNRPEFLKRTVRWYARHQIPLYIGDSSPKRTPLADVATRNTHHFHTPGANEIVASLIAADASDAEYLAWAGDDDFLLPNALQWAVIFLHQRPELTSVFGESIIMATVNDAVYGVPESAVAYTENDAFFRVYRRDVFIEGLRQAAGESSYDTRGRALERDFVTRDHERLRLQQLMLIRQVHPWRVTARKDVPWRARLGRRFPRAQYAKQWLQSWCWHHWRGQCWRCALTLPALYRRGSWSYDDFSEVVQFLSRG